MKFWSGWRSGLVRAAMLLAILAASSSSADTFVGPSSGGRRRGGPSGFSRTGLGSRRPPPCSHIGDSINGVTARAFLASTVFEGKARSRSRGDAGGVYGVTFVVQKVHKDLAGTLKERSQVRLQFRTGSEAPGPCRQTYNYTKRPGDLVRTNIKQGGKYIVFVMGVGPHNFTLLGEPVFKTRKNIQAAKDVLLCNNCIKPVNVSGLKDTRLEVGKKLKLVCRSRGNPQPAVTWYKDGLPVKASNSSRIEFRKKRSSLIIPKTRLDDTGRYECRATSVTRQVVSSWANVTVTVVPTLPTRAPTLLPYVPRKCPIETYCLNGGTCAYYDTIIELVCLCPEGYKGIRCENKDVFNQSNTSPEPWDSGPPTRVMTFF